jgi:DNA-binding transcriptional ArsR family regulator
VSPPLYTFKAEFFTTLGHPARIRVLELLADGGRSVGDLMIDVGLEPSNMSQQLSVLRRAGIVNARKQGNAVSYSLASANLAEFIAFAHEVLSGLLAGQVGLLKDLQASSRVASRAARP